MKTTKEHILQQIKDLEKLNHRSQRETIDILQNIVDSVVFDVDTERGYTLYEKLEADFNQMQQRKHDVVHYSGVVELPGRTSPWGEPLCGYRPPRIPTPYGYRFFLQKEEDIERFKSTSYPCPFCIRILKDLSDE